MTGTIIRLLPNKGYGFIRGEDGLMRFMHARNMKDVGDFERLHEGMRLSFTSEQGEVSERHNGLRAVDIEICS